MAEKQKTIKQEITIKGVGLHTGENCELTFKPAAENEGYKFIRTDMENKPVIVASVDNVVDTSRGTTLESGGAKVCTVEHVLSAVYGLGIDNITIEVTGSEIPIFDGSARVFVETLKKVDIVDQEMERNYYIVRESIKYENKEDKVELVVLPDEEYNLTVLIDYNSDVLANQFATLSTISDYEKEISPCRTFVFLHELEPLLNNNQIKGGNIENAIIIIDKEVTQNELNRLADLFNKPRIEVKPIGILNNLEPYFSNEPARHKLLDLIGDLALIGVRLKGRILATRPGHLSNVEFAREVRRIIRKERKSLTPIYDINKQPVLDINQIRSLLPHRPPFLLVDKILEISDQSIIGLKNVTMNEGFFAGHFPDEPVMPGVLIIEAMAQVGGILVLHSKPDPENYSTYFMKIENAKFKKKVVPGDTLIFKLEFVSPMRRGIANMRGQAFVGNTIVMEGEMMAQISKNKSDDTKIE